MQDEIFYLYEITNNGLEKRRVFKNYKELISFLADYQYREMESGRKNINQFENSTKIVWNNQYLDGINLTLNDCYSVIENFMESDKKFYIRPYVFFNKDLAIVDVRNFYDDIIKQQRINANKKYSDFYIERMHERYKGHIYRQNPVPRTGYRRRYRQTTRNVKYGQLIRDLKNPENKDFIRKKRYYNILEPYCDRPYKQRTKCWKDQTKNRHQWEKHKGK